MEPHRCFLDLQNTQRPRGTSFHVYHLSLQLGPTTAGPPRSERRSTVCEETQKEEILVALSEGTVHSLWAGKPPDDLTYGAHRTSASSHVTALIQK